MLLQTNCFKSENEIKCNRIKLQMVHFRNFIFIRFEKVLYVKRNHIFIVLRHCNVALLQT